MGEPLVFDFAVPDELLKESIARRPVHEQVADAVMMPGTGEGRPPALASILRQSGTAPLVLLTVAALIPGTINNGIALIGNNLEHSFHIHDAALGAVTFVASVAQLLWAVPLALLADRGSRRNVAAVALIIFSVATPFMGLSPNVWWFVFLYLIASVGYGVNNTVHNSYLSDAYPTEGRGRVFSWHNISDPLSQTIGILVFGLIVSATNDWRWGLLVGLAGIPIGLSLFTLREPDKGQNESSHILKASGMDLQTQQGQAPRVLLGSAVTRLLRIRSLYYELVAVAILGFAGTAAPLFGNLYFVRKWGLDVATRTEIYSIIGLAAFLGLPCAYVLGDRYFRRAPQRPLVIAGIAITAYGGLYVGSLYMPNVPAVVALQFLANAAVSPIAICIFLTLAATAPPGDANDLLCHVRRVLARVRRLRGGGRPRRDQRVDRGRQRRDRGADPHRPGVRDRRHPAGGRLALRETRHHPRDRGRARTLRRGAAAPGGRGDPGPPGPRPRLLLRFQPGAVRHQPRGRRG